MALGLLKPMTDWEKMTSARSILSGNEFIILCNHWQRGVLSDWGMAVGAKRSLKQNGFESWLESLDAVESTKKVPRELPQPPFWLR